MVEENDVIGLYNTVYSFFLRQIYWHIPVKMELWSSIVVFLCRLHIACQEIAMFFFASVPSSPFACGVGHQTSSP